MHSEASAPTAAPTRPTARFVWSHPAHAVALAFGAGLSPRAPGTIGTLWAWLTFLVMQHWLTPSQIAVVTVLAIAIGWWASAVAARNLSLPDPGCIVWDEVAAFWCVLLLLSPASWLEQLAAFLLFRLFDAAKPGPVGWADRLVHRLDPQRERFGWTGVGAGIMLDDLVAAFCCLFLMALWRAA